MARKKGNEIPFWRRPPGLENSLDLAGGSRVGEYGQERRAGGIFSREVIGANWSLVEGVGVGDGLEVLAGDERIQVTTFRPLLILEYSRAFGNLRAVHLNAVGLVTLAGTREFLEIGDLTTIGDLNEMKKGLLMSVLFGDNRPSLLVTDAVGKQIETALVVSNLGASEIGSVVGWPDYSWQGDLGTFNGRIGFEIFPDRVEFYYQRRDGFRVDVYRFRRELIGIPRLDRIVSRRMPSDEEMIGFMEAVIEEVK